MHTFHLIIVGVEIFFSPFQSNHRWNKKNAPVLVLCFGIIFFAVFHRYAMAALLCERFDERERESDTRLSGMNKWNRTWKRFLDCNTIRFYFMRMSFCVVLTIANLDMLIIIYLFIYVFIHSFIRSFSFAHLYCIYSPWSSR